MDISSHKNDDADHQHIIILSINRKHLHDHDAFIVVVIYDVHNIERNRNWNAKADDHVSVLNENFVDICTHKGFYER